MKHLNGVRGCLSVGLIMTVRWELSNGWLARSSIEVSWERHVGADASLVTGQRVVVVLCSIYLPQQVVDLVSLRAGDNVWQIVPVCAWPGLESLCCRDWHACGPEDHLSTPAGCPLTSVVLGGYVASAAGREVGETGSCLGSDGMV